MAPTPPALDEDAMSEVFMRLPADDPRSLVRAAAVCRSWRCILSDPGFARGYRVFHGAAPMLGFLHNCCLSGNRFVPTSTFRWQPSLNPECQVVDSRHGLVLLYTPAYQEAPFDVCDLVANKWWGIEVDPKCHDIMHWLDDGPEDFFDGHLDFDATVLCAKDPCDHLDCHGGGPFLVALLGSADQGGIAHATAYSSETREWSDKISLRSPGLHIDSGRQETAVVGNKVYVRSYGYECDSVVEYNIREQQLSVINVPESLDEAHLNLIGADDGMLLFASVLKPTLYLWSMEAGPRGAAAWARRRVIDLQQLLPRRALLDVSDVWAVAFAEGVSVIFLRTPAGLYALELNSGRANKVGEFIQDKVMPYTSFCTRAWGRLPASGEASRAVVGGGTMV